MEKGKSTSKLYGAKHQITADKTSFTYVLKYNNKDPLSLSETRKELARIFEPDEVHHIVINDEDYFIVKGICNLFDMQKEREYQLKQRWAIDKGPKSLETLIHVRAIADRLE